MRKNFVVHPFLIALYPVLFLYAYNIDEVELNVLMPPFLIALLLSFVCFFYFKLITKDTLKAGLITSILIFGFYIFGSIQDIFTDYFLKNIFLLIIFLLTSCIYLYWRFAKFINKEPSESVTKKILIYIYILAGYFFLNIIISYFTGLGFSKVRLFILFLIVVFQLIGFYFIYTFPFKKLNLSKSVFQDFLTVSLLIFILYIVIYQSGFKGITHRKLISQFGSFLIFLLVFLYYYKNDRIKKVALNVVVILILFFIHFLIYKNIETLNYNLLPELALSVFLVSLLFKIINSASAYNKLNKVLNCILIVLITLPLFNIMKSEIMQYKDENINISAFSKLGENNNTIENLPPIYYIVLDEYASTETIKELFNYDNTPFTETLKGKGFYVSDWQTTSEHTHEVLARVLNTGQDTKNLKGRNIFKAIQNNYATNYLKRRGYKIIQYPAWRYEKVFSIDNADTLIKVPKIGIRAKLEDFNSKILYSTILRRYISKNANFFRTAIDNIFSSVADLNKEFGKQAFFVYAHVMAPHAPFVFDKNGNEIGVHYEGNEFYLGQYIYISNKVTELVEKLQEAHSGNCVIIIQSDHGPRKEETEISTNDKQKYKIFNAIFLPDKNLTDIDKNISVNINTFAIVFNKLFDDSFKMKLVEDKK